MVSYKVDKEKSTIRCILIDHCNGVTRKAVGVAVGNPDDEWNEEECKKLAFNRARIQEIGRNISDYMMYMDSLNRQYKAIREHYVNKIKRQREAILTLRYNTKESIKKGTHA